MSNLESFMIAAYATKNKEIGSICNNCSCRTCDDQYDLSLLFVVHFVIRTRIAAL